MIEVTKFNYQPQDAESEKASNSYVMSLVAIIAGLPLPIINLIATGIFWLGNRNSTPFVKWHCNQAILSQLSVLVMNSVGFWWTIDVILQNTDITSSYIAYMITIFLFNLTEFIATIYTAVQTRKGVHVKWWLYGTITDKLTKN